MMDFLSRMKDKENLDIFTSEEAAGSILGHPIFVDKSFPENTWGIDLYPYEAYSKVKIIFYENGEIDMRIEEDE